MAPSSENVKRDRRLRQLHDVGLRSFNIALLVFWLAVLAVYIMALVLPIGDSLWVPSSTVCSDDHTTACTVSTVVADCGAGPTCGSPVDGFLGCYGRLIPPGCTDAGSAGHLGLWAQFAYIALALFSGLLVALFVRLKARIAATIFKVIGAISGVVVSVLSVILTLTLIYDAFQRCSPAGGGVLFGVSPGTLWCRPDLLVILGTGAPRWWALVLRLLLPAVYIGVSVSVIGLSVVLIAILVVGGLGGDSTGDRAVEMQQERRAATARDAQQAHDEAALMPSERRRTSARLARRRSPPASGGSGISQALAGVLALPASFKGRTPSDVTV